MLHHALAVLLLIIRIAAAIFGDPDIVQIQVQMIDIEIVDAGITDCGQNPPQVRVGRKKGGFHQRRMGYRVGDLAAFRSVFTLLYRDRDEFGRAFAIANDHLCQLLRNGGHRLRQRCIFAGRDIVDFQRGSAGGNQHEGIVGRGIAIDGDAIERGVGSLLDQMIEHRLRHFRVAGQKAQHRCHVRSDHASAFADAGQSDGDTINDHAA